MTITQFFILLMLFIAVSSEPDRPADYYESSDQEVGTVPSDAAPPLTPRHPTSTWEPDSYLKLGDKCDPVNDDCGANMECRKSTYCRGDEPVCRCAANFAEDRQANVCRRIVGLGEACRGDDVTCGPANSYCNEQDNQCQCRPDYKTGPLGNDCVWTWKTLFYGQTCRRSIQCHYNMSCDNYVCTCPAGSRVDPTTNAHCVINGLDNTCSKDDDCFRRNSVCVNGYCACQENYEAMTLRFNTIDATEQEVCVSIRVARRIAGQSCSLSHPFDDGVCLPGLVCSTQCIGGTGPVCVDPGDNRGLATTTRPPRIKQRLAAYGDRCESNSDCVTLDGSLTCKRQWASACRPVGNQAPSTSGICGCGDGFYFDASEKCLKKPPGAYLGQECTLYNRNDVVGNCIADGAVCAEGMCICKLGYKPGPRGDDCVSNWKTQFLGEECHDSIQCHYNMLCVNATCSCRGVGLPAKPIDDGSNAIVECTPVNAGDRCHSNADCNGVNNAFCSPFSKRCECHQGYVANVLHLNSPDDKTTWCLPDTLQLRDEGEECNFKQPPAEATTHGQNGPSEATLACGPDFYCSRCTEGGSLKDKSVCLRRDATLVVRQSTTTTKRMVLSVGKVGEATTTSTTMTTAGGAVTGKINGTSSTKQHGVISSTLATTTSLIEELNQEEVVQQDEAETTTPTIETALPTTLKPAASAFLAFDSGVRKMQGIRAGSTRSSVSSFFIIVLTTLLSSAIAKLIL